MSLRNAMLTALALLIGIAPALSEDETADERAVLSSSSGVVRLGDGGEAPRLAAGEAVPKGTPLNLGKDAEATVVFGDGSEMNLRGPARIKIVEMTPDMRRVDVSKGRVNSFSVGDVITGIHTPQNTFAVLRNGTIGVHVQDGKTTFNLFDGKNAKVVDVNAGKTVKLTPNEPYVVGKSEPVDAKPVKTGPGTKDLRRIRVGNRVIKLSPADAWDVEETETGGVQLTCKVPAGEFGSVQLGLHTVFYVPAGGVMQLDSSGNVVAHRAAVHVQVSMFDPRNIYDQAFSPPADSSPIKVR